MQVLLLYGRRGVVGIEECSVVGEDGTRKGVIGIKGRGGKRGQD